ncbi:zinc protease [Enhydrobacter aerosaccus]|uniref:Zinc protease n=1 Tax=Enhydrobacter aerosaccus TaxID=225324 RepID=A0A1T4SUI3_9HYPH|nr:pitrilysin family protein [Enhydrobacter aerosaccus]SKA31817.1 zinc protease [Enhydrobacter aerosaccus]
MRIVAYALALLVAGLFAGRAEAVEIQEVTTPLGIKAWLVEDRSAPLVALSFSFADGTASEPESQKGVTSLMATMLTDGAGALTADIFRRREEDAATHLSFGASSDRLSGTLRVLTASRDEGFDLLRLAVTEPRFDSDMLDQRRDQAIAGLNQAEQSPRSVAERTLMASMFAGHPYSRDASGLRETLKTLTPADLKGRARSVLQRRGLIVAAVGDIDAQTLARQLDRAFGALPEGELPAALPDWAPPAGSRTIAIERPVPQSAVLMAMPGVLRRDPDWYAALILSHILGGGQQSRLFEEVREKRGLAYSVSASLRSSAKASMLVVSTGSANDRVAEAIHVIQTVLARLRTEGVTEQEVADAKTYLTGSLALSLDSSGAIAGLLHGMQIDGLPRDFLDHRADLIAAVTKADVDRMAQRLLRDDAVTTVVVGKPVGLAVER